MGAKVLNRATTKEVEGATVQHLKEDMGLRLKLVKVDMGPRLKLVKEDMGPRLKLVKVDIGLHLKLVKVAMDLDPNLVKLAMGPLLKVVRVVMVKRVKVDTTQARKLPREDMEVKPVVTDLKASQLPLATAQFLKVGTVLAARLPRPGTTLEAKLPRLLRPDMTLPVNQPVGTAHKVPTTSPHKWAADILLPPV